MERRKRFGWAFRQNHKHPAGLRSSNKPPEGFDPVRYSGAKEESGESNFKDKQFYGELITASICALTLFTSFHAR